MPYASWPSAHASWVGAGEYGGPLSPHADRFPNAMHAETSVERLSADVQHILIRCVYVDLASAPHVPLMFGFLSVICKLSS